MNSIATFSGPQPLAQRHYTRRRRLGEFFRRHNETKRNIKIAPYLEKMQAIFPQEVNRNWVTLPNFHDIVLPTLTKRKLLLRPPRASDRKLLSNVYTIGYAWDASHPKIYDLLKKEGVGRIKDNSNRNDLHRVMALTKVETPKKALGMIHYKIASINRSNFILPLSNNTFIMQNDSEDEEDALLAARWQDDDWDISKSDSIENKECKIISIKISENKRGQKYGTLLISYAMLEAIQRNCKRCILESESSAIPFYESLGFERIQDTHLMIYDLTNEEKVAKIHSNFTKALNIDNKE